MDSEQELKDKFEKCCETMVLPLAIGCLSEKTNGCHNCKFCIPLHEWMRLFDEDEKARGV